MLITFETKAYANITMFGEIAKKLIKSMGHSGTVPGAIQAKDLPKALEQLKIYLRAEIASVNDDQETPEDENYVSIDKRAKPLIELLEAAIEQNEAVMWDE
ncbi:MAG: DUF1840 domain-containing protein [Gammaproteobacteria bacterium]|nr:DUF1840 domain-containing protein [Gammaproteobacteria bacterium]